MIQTFHTPTDLAAKIHALLHEPSLRRRLEKNARAYAKANSWRVIAKKHIKLYRALTK